jgi:hypothetical protein
VDDPLVPKQKKEKRNESIFLASIANKADKKAQKKINSFSLFSLAPKKKLPAFAGFSTISPCIQKIPPSSLSSSPYFSSHYLSPKKSN